MSTNVIAAHPLGRLPGPVNSADAMLNAPILPTLVGLSLSNMMAMLAMALVTIAETAYVGGLGTPPLAGLALVFPLVMLQQMMSGGAMGGGVSSAISRALGAGDERRASDLAFHALVIGCAFGVVSTIKLLLFGEPIYRLLGGRDAALSQALAYSNIVYLGATGIWLTNMRNRRVDAPVGLRPVGRDDDHVRNAGRSRGRVWLGVGHRQCVSSETWHGGYRGRPSHRL